MRKALTTTLTLSAVAALGLGLGPVAAAAYDDDRRGDSRSGDRDDDGDDLRVIGLSNGTTLSSFRTDDPGRTSRIGVVNLSGDGALVGIDFRVQNGALYGVGNAGGVYRIDTADAAATKVGQLTVALSGTSFGVDFNPAANALRVISDTGQNLRQPFATLDDGVDGNQAPTLVDGTLNLPGGQATPVPGPASTGNTGAAYSNNDLDARTGTTLFDINTTTDTVAIQSPANSGFLAVTGSLGVDFAPDSGFDVYSKVRPERTGKAVQLFPYAVSNGVLYDIDLLNGQADSDGAIGTANGLVTDIAIPLNQL